MNVEIGAEAALFPGKEYIKGIFVAVYSMVLSVIEFLNGGFLLLNVFSKNGNINNLHFNMRSIVDLFHIRVLLYQKWSIMKTRSADKPTVYMYVAEFVSCTMTKIKYISKVQKNILPANCR